MHDNSEADDGFVIPAKHARKARSRQGTKGSPPWGTFLASLQNQTQEKPSSRDIVENWAGTVFWNDVWEKSIVTEAGEAKKKKQAAVDAVHASISNAPGADASPAAGAISIAHSTTKRRGLLVPAGGSPLLPLAAPPRRSSRGHRIPPGPLNIGDLLRRSVYR
ncbi:hypothetical protein ABBQ38_004458 [Trebouxia sp. C0009 RCD-2024]